MRLRSITLHGFKTFARPTEIAFEGGVTAVVGPNGSGKTNVVDAFRWVLGEGQARDLRGRRMEDVIYAGGDRRARASSAEVTLVVDNSDRRLPVDYAEVSIRRRVDRSGQSDYFLNGSRVRRRDVLDLLGSTGLTTDSYAIVTQSDIESIVSCSPEQRRVLIEEAAQVRGVKARRSEAATRLSELGQNLLRLEDLRSEIQPRLEAVRMQAAAAREAAEASRRLDRLRGSLLFEEWREAREAHRRAAAQLLGLQRRLADASEQAAAAEAAFQAERQEVEIRQDRRLQRQRLIGSVRLELSAREHDLAMALERRRNQSALADAARAELAELAARADAADALAAQLERELAAARAAQDGVGQPPPLPDALDAEAARESRRRAEAARRAAQVAASSLATARSRRQFHQDTVRRLEQAVLPAEAELAAAAAAAEEARQRARGAAAAAADLVRVRAELEGIEALRPAPEGGLRRLADVLTAEAGYEAALSAALGPLADAWAAADEGAAEARAEAGGPQTTIVHPGGPAAVALPGSLAEHVSAEPGFEGIVPRLLGRIGLERGEVSVTMAGRFRAPGLLRAGTDPRVRLARRRRELQERVAALAGLAASAEAAEGRARELEGRAAEIRAAAAARGRLDEAARQLSAALQAETEEEARLPRLEAGAAEAEALAQRMARAIEEHDRLLAEHRAETRRLDLERARWRDRVDDLRRQLAAITADAKTVAGARTGREERIAQAERAAADAGASALELEAAIAAVRTRLEAAERESPEEEAELASGARRLVALEEARVDARLRVGTLEGTAGLASRDAELAAGRMEELRARLPEGLAPEEIPGGRSREREMRALERRLEEIGPTNPLAETEAAELEARFGTLVDQLHDIAAARADLETLVTRLREQEESRYDAVFGAVAANFQEFYVELNGGGRATLKHVGGADGPRSGVEILVQPPRKKLQTLTLLSSGERSLTALAMVLALEAVNPSPFTLLDEVDAALDDANVGRFTRMLQRLGRERQFLVITHNHSTMASAGGLYGVHLDESGSSHLVSVRLEDVRPQTVALGAAS